MKIRKFYENEVQGPDGLIGGLSDMSPEKIKETIDNLTEILNTFNKKLSELKTIETDLSKFKSGSKSNLDQIDNSFTTIQSINGDLENEILNKLDTVITNLKDRLKNGKSYII